MPTIQPSPPNLQFTIDDVTSNITLSQITFTFALDSNNILSYNVGFHQYNHTHAIGSTTRRWRARPVNGYRAVPPRKLEAYVLPDSGDLTGDTQLLCWRI